MWQSLSFIRDFEKGRECIHGSRDPESNALHHSSVRVVATRNFKIFPMFSQRHCATCYFIKGTSSILFEANEAGPNLESQESFLCLKGWTKVKCLSSLSPWQSRSLTFTIAVCCTVISRRGTSFCQAKGYRCWLILDCRERYIVSVWLSDVRKLYMWFQCMRLRDIIRCFPIQTTKTRTAQSFSRLRSSRTNFTLRRSRGIRIWG